MESDENPPSEHHTSGAIDRELIPFADCNISPLHPAIPDHQEITGFSFLQLQIPTPTVPTALPLAPVELPTPDSTPAPRSTPAPPTELYPPVITELTGSGISAATDTNFKLISSNSNFVGTPNASHWTSSNSTYSATHPIPNSSPYFYLSDEMDAAGGRQSGGREFGGREFGSREFPNDNVRINIYPNELTRLDDQSGEGFDLMGMLKESADSVAERLSTFSPFSLIQNEDPSIHPPSTRRRSADARQYRTPDGRLRTPDVPSKPGLIPRDLAEQLRKGVSFTANVAGSALRMPELKGLPKAPRVPKSALDLSNAAVKFIDEERSNRQFDNRDNRDVSRFPSLEELAIPPLFHEQFHDQVQVQDQQSTHLQSAHTDLSPPTSPLFHRHEFDFPSPRTLPPRSVLKDFRRHSSFDSGRHSDKKLSTEDFRDLVRAGSAVPTLAEKVPPPSVPISQPGRPATLDKLVLMTFNAGLLEYRLGGMTWYSNPPFTKRRLYQIAPALGKADCDVVALQEVYDEWQADYLTESLRVTYPFVARRTSGGAFSLHNGLMIMSRFPVLHTAFHAFDSVTPIEKMFCSKGMLEATIEIPTIGRVMFLNIHLASGAVDPESQALEALRNEEIQQAFTVCRAATLRGEIPVLIGDLNAAPNLCASNYRIFLEHGWRDGFLLAVKGQEAGDGPRQLLQLDSWRSGLSNQRETLSDAVSLKMSQGVAKVKKVLGLSEASIRRLLFNDNHPEFRSRRHRDGGTPEASGTRRARERYTVVHNPSKARKRRFPRFKRKHKETSRSEFHMAVARQDSEIESSFGTSATRSDSHAFLTSKPSTGASSPISEKEDSQLLTPSITPSVTPLRKTRQESRQKRMLSTTTTEFSDIVELDLERDPFCTQIFTWDPLNPLNEIGPHAECHGLRCDHVFLPPLESAGGLKAFRPVDASVVFTEPQVTVEGCCCGLMGQGSLVTLSDHYAVRLELIREKTEKE